MKVTTEIEYKQHANILIIQNIHILQHILCCELKLFHSRLHSNIKVHSLPDCVSSFLCIQAMNVMLASWHTGQPTSLSLCLVYMWQGHNRVLDNRPLIEWLAGSGIHPRSSVTPLPRASYGSWSVSSITLLWWRGEGAHCSLEIWTGSQGSRR